jgi:hypothetical protein
VGLESKRGRVRGRGRGRRFAELLGEGEQEDLWFESETVLNTRPQVNPKDKLLVTSQGEKKKEEKRDKKKSN